MYNQSSFVGKRAGEEKVSFCTARQFLPEHSRSQRAKVRRKDNCFTGHYVQVAPTSYLTSLMDMALAFRLRATMLVTFNENGVFITTFI